MKDDLQPGASQEEEIDLVEVTRKILKDWKVVLKACMIAVLVGLIIAFSIPKEYTTTVQLAPEMIDISSKGNLGSLAEMAGLNLNTSLTGDAFSLELYPDIVTSTPFLLKLFSLEVKNTKTKEVYSLYDYLLEHHKSAWWTYIFKAPFELLRWIKSLFLDDLQMESSEKNVIYILSKEQGNILKLLREKVSVSIDNKTFVISISVQMQDPMISAQLTQVVLENLQEYIISYRTQKARQDLEFTEKVYVKAKQRYFDVQNLYAEFKDSNKHISTAKYRTEQEKLRNEMSLAYSVYNSLSQKLEQDRLRVQEQTPVFALIEPAKLPLEASSPRKVLILIGFIFLGVLCSVGYILFKEPLHSILSEIKTK